MHKKFHYFRSKLVFNSLSYWFHIYQTRFQCLINFVYWKTGSIFKRFNIIIITRVFFYEHLKFNNTDVILLLIMSTLQFLSESVFRLRWFIIRTINDNNIYKLRYLFYQTRFLSGFNEWRAKTRIDINRVWCYILYECRR